MATSITYKGWKLDADRSYLAALFNSTEAYRITASAVTIALPTTINSTAAITGAATFTGAILPSVSNTPALGSATLMWADLFLGSAAVINFNNGDITLTHGTNKTLDVASTWSTAAVADEMFSVTLTTNVSLGSYANAFFAKVDCQSVGGATGLLSAGCFEIVSPTTGIAGTTAALELEMGYGATCGALQKPCFIYAATYGTAKTDFDTYGDFVTFGDGLTAGTGKMVGAGTSTLRIGTGALGQVHRYIPLSTAEASFTTAYPIATTSTLTTTCTTSGISCTASTLNATTGRVGYFSGSIAAPNLGDGYGAVEVDVTFTGTYAGISAALSAWVNVTGTGAVGSYIVAAQNNGIYADSGANTGSTVIFGMRAQGILTDAPTVFAPFSLNTSNRAITALFHMTSNPDVGYLANSGTSGGKVGDVPLFCDGGGTQYFVRIYSARG